MSYAITKDFEFVLDEHETEAIRRDYEKTGVDKLPIGISYAEKYVGDKLGQRYDMATEFAKTGSNRNEILLEIIMHIAVWKLCVVFPTVTMDGKRYAFYDKAMEDLKDAQKGNLLNDLPTIDDPAEQGITQYGEMDNQQIIF